MMTSMEDTHPPSHNRLTRMRQMACHVSPPSLSFPPLFPSFNSPHHVVYSLTWCSRVDETSISRVRSSKRPSAAYATTSPKTLSNRHVTTSLTVRVSRSISMRVRRRRCVILFPLLPSAYHAISSDLEPDGSPPAQSATST